MKLDTPAKVQAKISSLQRDYALQLKRADIEMNHARSPAIERYDLASRARDQAKWHIDRCEQISYLIECLEMGDLEAYYEATGH